MSYFTSKPFSPGFHYGKQIKRRTYRSLDEQRQRAQNSLKHLGKFSDKTTPTDAEMFAQVSSGDDLVTVIQLRFGGNKDRIKRVLKFLDTFNEWSGGQGRYFEKPLQPPKFSKAVAKKKLTEEVGLVDEDDFKPEYTERLRVTRNSDGSLNEEAVERLEPKIPSENSRKWDEV